MAYPGSMLPRYLGTGNIEKYYQDTCIYYCTRVRTRVRTRVLLKLKYIYCVVHVDVCTVYSSIAIACNSMLPGNKILINTGTGMAIFNTCLAITHDVLQYHV